MALLDLDVVVTAQERSDWILDASALQSLLPRGAEIVCQLTPDTRRYLLQLLNERVKEYGSSQELWRPDLIWGTKDYSNHTRALRAERILMVYQETLRVQRSCPYWLQPRERFLGIHRDAGRIQLLAETMGGGQVQTSNGQTHFGGSAQGRIFAMFGIGAHWGIALGGEVGIASIFPKDDIGQRNVKAQWTVGLPIMIRGWIDNLRVDGEIATVARFQDSLDDQDAQGVYGVRVAAGIGLSTLRIFSMLPHLMIWGGSETYFSSTLTQVFRLGTRIGISI